MRRQAPLDIGTERTHQVVRRHHRRIFTRFLIHRR
jgi:hypothetical protein